MAKDNDYIVIAKDLSKIYEGSNEQIKALNDITLKIRRGEIVAIMGPSGCGKTTLLNCLSGLDEPTKGSVMIAGKALSELDDDQRSEYRAQNMGFIFQFQNLLPILTVLENVQLPLLNAKLTPSEVEKKAMKVLGLVKLAKRHHHKPSELSGGECQRVAIARALINDPAIVWADEPTGNLDSDNSQQIMKLILTLNKQLKQTIVLVTHDFGIGNMAGRIIEMRNGRIISDTKKA
jgi:putative ABC transport system ATP-binding protein